MRKNEELACFLKKPSICPKLYQFPRNLLKQFWVSSWISSFIGTIPFCSHNQWYFHSLHVLESVFENIFQSCTVFYKCDRKMNLSAHFIFFCSAEKLYLTISIYLIFFFCLTYHHEPVYLQERNYIHAIQNGKATN